jgi:hypothetical protein
MQILQVTLATTLVVMLLHPILEKLGEKQSFKYHFHHSILGVFIFILGIILGNSIVIGLGAGVYLGHVFEEIYFCKTNVFKAFLIFVTR